MKSTLEIYDKCLPLPKNYIGAAESSPKRETQPEKSCCHQCGYGGPFSDSYPKYNIDYPCTKHWDNNTWVCPKCSNANIGYLVNKCGNCDRHKNVIDPIACLSCKRPESAYPLKQTKGMCHQCKTIHMRNFMKSLGPPVGKCTKCNIKKIYSRDTKKLCKSCYNQS